MTAAVVVTTPQEVALADCRKGLAMFDSVGVPSVASWKHELLYL